MPANPPRAPGELAEIERRAFAESMRAWGENDPNPEWFAGDCLSIVLMDCGRAGAMIDTLLDEIAALRASGDGAEAMRDDVVSARLTAWKDDYGGVELIFGSGRRVALALDAPHRSTEVPDA